MNDSRRIATIGVFDGVHAGHRCLLGQLKDRAAELGLRPTVFTFDSHPLALIAPDKAPKLLMSADERLQLLKEQGVDVVRLDFDRKLQQLDARSFMQLLKDCYGVRAIVMGFNHRFGSDRIDNFAQYAAIGREVGIDIILATECRDVGEVSSSLIRKAIGRGDMERATAMLGRPYSLSGKVVAGRALGRTIGFPTANISPSETAQLLPPVGVYVVDAEVGGTKRRGVLNIGYRPTVDHSDTPSLSIELHLIAWSGELYGDTVTVNFLRRLRDEMAFDSVESLAAQLKSDCESALRME